MKKGNKIILSVIACFTLTTGLYADINKIKDLEPLKEKEMLENIEKYLNDNINHHNHSKNI